MMAPTNGTKILVVSTSVFISSGPLTIKRAWQLTSQTPPYICVAREVWKEFSGFTDIAGRSEPISGDDVPE
jgi:hypothetical protein